jgi:hypothetical protein
MSIVYAQGEDYSKYDFPVTNVNPDFVIQRAGYGMNRDEKFEEIYATIQNVPVKGSYHYFSTNIPWKEQADRYLEIIKNKGFQFIVEDYERTYNNLNAKSANDLGYMMSYLQSKLLDNNLHRLLYYTNKDIHENNLNIFADWMNAYEFWYAQYKYRWSNLDNGPVLPKNRKDYTFWQFGADAAFCYGWGEGKQYGSSSYSVDRSRFNGTQPQLIAWAGSQVVPIPVHTYQYVVITTALNIRDNHPVNGNLGNIVGQLVYGKTITVDVIDSVTNWAHLISPIIGWCNASSNYIKKL